MFNLHVQKQSVLSKSVQILKYFPAQPKIFFKIHQKIRAKCLKTLCSEIGCSTLCAKVNHQHQNLKKNAKTLPLTKPNSLTNSGWTTPDCRSQKNVPLQKKFFGKTTFKLVTNNKNFMTTCFFNKSNTYFLLHFQMQCNGESYRPHLQALNLLRTLGKNH
jgi:hypothetical protein